MQGIQVVAGGLGGFSMIHALSSPPSRPRLLQTVYRVEAKGDKYVT